MALAQMYLTEGTNRLRFPIVPNNVSVKVGTTVVSFVVIKDGEHKIPRGTSVTGYSWNGMLPGEAMSDLGFVFDWRSPMEIVNLLKTWQATGAILDFTVTEVGIKDTVFIDNATYTHKGAGNIEYQLSLSSYRPMTIKSAPKQPKVKIPKEGKDKKKKTKDKKQKQTTTKPKNVPEQKPTDTEGQKPLSGTIPPSTGGLVQETHPEP